MSAPALESVAPPPERSGRSNFFIAFRVLPSEQRRAIGAVYGFCRRADDAVDLVSDPGAARAALQGVGQELDEVFAEGDPSPALAPLADAVRRFRLPRQPFEDLLDGMRWDLEGRRYATAEELREYCHRVASSVGLLCVRIFGCTDPECDAYARELGVALQWTNILRDLGSDLAQGRVYLPSDSLRRHGLEPEHLHRKDPDTLRRVSRLVRDEAAFARARFAAAERALPRRERSRVLAGRIMGEMYRVLLRKVERVGAGVLERRVRLSGVRRALLAAKLLAADRLRRLAGGAT